MKTVKHYHRQRFTGVTGRAVRLAPGFLIAMLMICLSIVAVAKSPPADYHSDGSKADTFLIVDCLLPGQLRKMGSRMSYLSPRRPIKTSATDCEIRGGEYVAYDRADYSTALKIWLPQAKEGDPIAQTYVGEIYEKGLGLDPDYQFAAYWYQQAVQQGYSRALINLGHLYEIGLGVERDPRMALNLYRQASGIEGDQLLFASSLVSSHVPREQFRSVQSELAAEKQSRSELEQELAVLRKDMAQRSTRLAQTQRQLEITAQKITQLTATATGPTPATDSREEIELTTKMQALEEERGRLQRQVAQLDRENQLLQKDSGALARQLDAKEQSRQRSEQQLAQLQQDVQRSSQQLQQAEQDLAEMKQQLAAGQSEQSASASSLGQLQRQLEAKSAALSQARQQHAELERASRQREQELQSAVENYAQKTQQVSSLHASTVAEKARLAEVLAKREQQLQDTNHQLLLAKAALQMERGNLAEAAGQSAEQQALMAQQQKELARLSEQLEQQYTLVKTQKSKIKELQQQTQLYSDGLNSTAAQGEQLAALGEAPKIEIIEPPVVLVRSMPTVKLLSRGGERQIVGKVVAPAGIVSLSVNGKAVDLGKNNLFRSNIPIDVAPKPVNVVVVDAQGRRSAVAFTFVEESAASPETQPQVVAKPPAKTKTARRNQQAELGNYYALIIGNNNYQQFSTLATAVKDATETDKLLREKYNFKTRLLLNADRYSILSALNELRETLKPSDNLLIYYAGHGMLDETNGRGYWLPVDADSNNNANWISNTAITDILNVIEAKHILIVADSCFSGTLTQTPLARAQTDVPQDVRDQWIKVMSETRARITLTSGGLEPVLDGGGGEHSLFAQAFLSTLRDNNTILEGYSLYYQVLTRMGTNTNLDVSPVGASTQVPQYAPIHLAGHESGEFFFAPG